MHGTQGTAGTPGHPCPCWEQEMQPRELQDWQSTYMMRDPHHGLRPCQYLGALASPWTGMEGGRLAALAPLPSAPGHGAGRPRTPRRHRGAEQDLCALESPGAAGPYGNPKPGSCMGGGLGCSWHGAAQGWEGRSPPPGWRRGRSRLPALQLARRLFGLFGSVGEWPGGCRDGDALYTGNTCLMRDAHLPPQAGTRTGATEIPRLTQCQHTHAQLLLHTDTSTMLMAGHQGGTSRGPQGHPGWGWGTPSIPAKGPGTHLSLRCSACPHSRARATSTSGSRARQVPHSKPPGGDDRTLEGRECPSPGGGSTWPHSNGQ